MQFTDLATAPRRGAPAAAKSEATLFEKALASCRHIGGIATVARRTSIADEEAPSTEATGATGSGQNLG